MNKKEFYERIGSKYKIENTYDLEDLKRYITENYHSDDFQWLYDEMIYNYSYKGIPSVKFVKDILDVSGKGVVQAKTKYDEIIQYNNREIDKWMSWNVNQVMFHVLRIDKKKEKNSTDELYWSLFGELNSEFVYMKEKEYSKEGVHQHLERCLDDIKIRKPITSIIIKEQFNVKPVFDEKKMQKDLNRPKDKR